jgi:hypothetical protein
MPTMLGKTIGNVQAQAIIIGMNLVLRDGVLGGVYWPIIT